MAAPQPAPTRSRGLSVKSEQSQNSANSSKGHQRGPSESSQEKHRRSLQTKADPLVAMNELQPSTFGPNRNPGRIAFEKKLIGLTPFPSCRGPAEIKSGLSA